MITIGRQRRARESDACSPAVGIVRSSLQAARYFHEKIPSKKIQEKKSVPGTEARVKQGVANRTLFPVVETGAFAGGLEAFTELYD
jgi:hypothetical protein